MSKQTNRQKEKKQKISGVVLIDKPRGMTSQQVVSKVKKLLHERGYESKKAGHTGTLDPMAVGLLPICLGEATKFSHHQLDADKTYQAVIQLGMQTDTGDADGTVISEADVSDINDALLNQVASYFMGEQSQIPPMYSALKKDGKKLYEYARLGETVHREARPITIKNIHLSRIHSDQIFLEVTCSKGTYIRVLAEDIAKKLGTLAHLTMLKRTQVGHFDIHHAVSLEQFEKMPFENRLQQLLAIDACIDNLPFLILSQEQSERIQHGQRLNVSEQINQIQIPFDEMDNIVEVRLFDENQCFLGLAEVSKNGRLQPIKLVVY